MSRKTTVVLATSLGLLLAGAGGGVTADMAEEPTGTTTERALWEFQVLLDGRDIGIHRFDIQQDDGLERVDIEARFEVEFMFITAYRYVHDNQETWRDDCLQQIESSTDDNGEQYELTGQAGTDSFTLDRNDATEAIETPCLKTFAYWNPEILEADRLLNAQTGEWKPVTVESVGVTPFEVAGVPVASEEYRLLIPDGAIRLWYQQDNGQWLGLETQTKGGRTLRYEPLSLPHPPGPGAGSRVARRSEQALAPSP
ncbi:MAG: DUF6134 family protein [Xanthomonadales bacterium]|nr:DUF6134 family protein [Xanthomonadales bacterium]